MTIVEDLLAENTKLREENASLTHRIKLMHLETEAVADKCKSLLEYIKYVQRERKDTRRVPEREPLNLFVE